MKTQILHLESYDDRHSIFDKLDWGQADRAILIWPLRGQPLSSKLDLKLIHRRCQTSGMKLALVCRDASIKEYAQGLNIPVFRSLRKAQQIAWEYAIAVDEEQTRRRPERKFSREELKQQVHSRRQPGWADKPRVRLASISTSIMAVLALVIFLVPSAQVSYLPKLDTQTLQLNLVTDPNIRSFNLSGTIPIEAVTISVEGRADLESSGEIGIPDQAATGLIEFTNITNSPVSVPKGTTIRTANSGTSIRFITLTQTNLAGAVGATATVPIEAVNPGSSSNVAENELVMIDGNLGLSLTATNPEPTSGGSDRVSAAPTLEDYDTLRNQLIDSLWENALEELENSLQAKDIILYPEPSHIAISEERFSPEEPQPSNSLSLLLRVEFDVQVIRWETFQAMGNAILDATIPEGYTSQPDTLSYSEVTDPNPGENDTSSWEVLIFRQIFTSRNLPEAVKAIAGKPSPEAAKILQENLELPNKPEIQISPSWWRWLPLLETRINLSDLRGAE